MVLGRLIPRSNKDSIDRPLNVSSLDQTLQAAKVLLVTSKISMTSHESYLSY